MLECIGAAVDIFGFVKINVVVITGFNDDEICSFVELTRKNPRVAVRFIEYMPFQGIINYSQRKLVE